MNYIYINKMFEPLEYYYENGTHVKFNKYTIDIWGVIRNKKSGKILSCRKNKDEYNVCGVVDNEGKQVTIRIARAIASTFIGPPSTLEHTADHKNKNRGDDTLDNICWADKSEQINNQTSPENKNNAFIVIKNDIEKTIKEWVEYLKDQKNHMGREYTIPMIRKYAQTKQNGFSYKEYPDLPNEVWKKIENSENGQGHWEISDMNRVKYVTKHAENVLAGERLCIKNGYPKISINGKSLYCHIIVFKTFFSDEYEMKKPDEMVLHENDDPIDFRPYKLRIGTKSENGIDAHNNGSFDGKKTTRMKCTSYIKGIFEKEHDSQDAAVKYLKYQGYTKASQGNIRQALTASRDGKDLMKYDRTWKIIT